MLYPRTVLRGKTGALALALIAVSLVAAPSAQATHANPEVQHLSYRVGPLQVTPGQNRIAYRTLRDDKPQVDGWIVGMKPNLVNADGSVPSTDRVMFHHGVWLNLSHRDLTVPNGLPERFMATGEEKTKMILPAGFGLRHEAGDRWLLNHMIHNLTAASMELYVTYTIDFIPDSSPAAAGIKPVVPLWMDVVNGSGYPVFDVLKGSGGRDNRFTYPADVENPYPDGIRRNLYQLNMNGTLVTSAGHVHTGGLSTDLWMMRSGARYEGPKCGQRRTAKLRRQCWARSPRVRGNRVHLFHSKAKYFEPRGPVSWDVAMTGTRPGWLVEVQKGDVLALNTTYETKLASWYESMGISVVYFAPGDTSGRNPYRTKVDWPGQVTHGHLPENNVHGGSRVTLPNPANMAGGPFPSSNILIDRFAYGLGDFRLPGMQGRPPRVRRGRSLTFELAQGDASQEIWHSVTSCAPPCNRNTGIAYPIPNGEHQFDSGQLGDFTPAVYRRTWETPKDLPVGTYTYFCRIHPMMRGAFRVVK